MLYLYRISFHFTFLYQFCYVIFCFAMAFDHCLIKDYLITYLLKCKAIPDVIRKWSLRSNVSTNTARLAANCSIRILYVAG